MRLRSIGARLAAIGLWLNLATAGPLSGSDPSIILHTDDNYYLVEAARGGISIRKSTYMEGFSETESTSVWKDSNGLTNIWAPQIVRDGDSFYIYFAGGEGADHRMYVIASDQPGWGYAAEETALSLPDGQWAIDGTLLRYGGELWFVWSGWADEGANEQNLYICRMKSPIEPAGPRYIISQPREPWERVVGDPFINEGPEVIIDPAGQLHIVYSADGSWSESYCLADLRLKEGGDPTNVWDWYKSNGCLMGSKEDQMMDGWEVTKDVNGPGHHTFALPGGGPDGRRNPDVDYPFMYHAVRKGTEYKWGNRERFAGFFRWVGGVTYSRQHVPGDNENVGWSLKFFE